MKAQDISTTDLNTVLEGLQKAHDFLLFCWRDVALNDYAEDARATTELAVCEAMLVARRLAVQMEVKNAQ